MRLKLPWSCALAGLLLLAAGGLTSADLIAADNPYAAVVPVEDESDASRRKALRAALILVIKRVVGRNDSSTGEVLDRAASLVQQYRFVRDADSDALSFYAAFDPQGVEAAIKARGIAGIRRGSGSGGGLDRRRTGFA